VRRAYNAWLNRVLQCGASAPLGPATISLWNIEHAVRELERLPQASCGTTIGLVPAE